MAKELTMGQAKKFATMLKKEPFNFKALAYNSGGRWVVNVGYQDKMIVFTSINSVEIFSEKIQEKAIQIFETGE